MKDILRYKNILLSIVIIVVAIFVIKGMVSKYLSTINGLKAKMEDLEKVKVLVDKWDGVTSQYNNLSKKFFSQDPSLFKKFVEEQTKATGINVNYLSPSRKDADFYMEASLSMRASSESYANIINFIKSVEERKIIIEALKIKAAEKRRSVDITLKSYILEGQ